mmetsp:Transcript_54276/g.125024  ORF Transcript_54276/g.125024 Transcript_54276/m.125024 type:complete len:481 (+) Transcript_54276:364-1806(+)
MAGDRLLLRRFLRHAVRAAYAARAAVLASGPGGAQSPAAAQDVRGGRAMHHAQGQARREHHRAEPVRRQPRSRRGGQRAHPLHGDNGAREARRRRDRLREPAGEAGGPCQRRAEEGAAAGLPDRLRVLLLHALPPRPVRPRGHDSLRLPHRSLRGRRRVAEGRGRPPVLHVRDAAGRAARRYVALLLRGDVPRRQRRPPPAVWRAQAARGAKAGAPGHRGGARLRRGGGVLLHPDGRRATRPHTAGDRRWWRRRHSPPGYRLPGVPHARLDRHARRRHLVRAQPRRLRGRRRKRRRVRVAVATLVPVPARLPGVWRRVSQSAAGREPARLLQRLLPARHAGVGWLPSGLAWTSWQRIPRGVASAAALRRRHLRPIPATGGARADALRRAVHPGVRHHAAPLLCDAALRDRRGSAGRLPRGEGRRSRRLRRGRRRREARDTADAGCRGGRRRGRRQCLRVERVGSELMRPVVDADAARGGR